MEYQTNTNNKPKINDFFDNIEIEKKETFLVFSLFDIVDVIKLFSSLGNLNNLNNSISVLYKDGEIRFSIFDSVSNSLITKNFIFNNSEKSNSFSSIFSLDHFITVFFSDKNKKIDSSHVEVMLCLKNNNSIEATFLSTETSEKNFTIRLRPNYEDDHKCSVLL